MQLGRRVQDLAASAAVHRSQQAAAGRPGREACASLLDNVASLDTHEEDILLSMCAADAISPRAMELVRANAVACMRPSALDDADAGTAQALLEAGVDDDARDARDAGKAAALLHAAATADGSRRLICCTSTAAA